MRLPFVILHGIVLGSLIARGRRWMAIVPILVLLFLVARYYQRQQYLAPVVAQQLLSAFQTYGLATAWTVLVFGFWQLLHIFGLVGMQTPLRFLAIHFFGYLVSILVRKKDPQVVFHRGRRVSSVLLFIYGINLGGRGLFVDLLSGRIAVTMALYAFIVFILGPLGYPAPRRITALLFIFIQLTILIRVIQRSDELSVWTVLGGQIYLGVLYRLLQKIGTHAPLASTQRADETSEDDLLYAILRGERLHDRVQDHQADEQVMVSLLHQVRDELGPLLHTLPQRAFSVIGGLNIVAMLIQTGLFVAQGASVTGRELEIAFWTSVAVYIMNYVILQQQGVAAWGQRLVVFLLVNFGIYLTIFHLVGSVPLYLVGCGIVRSLLNAVFMIQLRQSGNRLGLSDEDYRYRLIGNMVAVVINTYFIFLLPVSVQLRFTLAAMYIALQFLLLKYQIEGLRIAEQTAVSMHGDDN